ncbi:MAG: hypothetical protein R3F61_03835 [Myxococcota bacterium]
MDWERPTEEGTDGVLGWLSVACGVLGIVSHMLCCVMGAFSLVFTVALTSIGLLTGFVGYRQARGGGDQHALSIVGLVLGAANTLVLCVVLVMQCYFASLIAVVLLAEH